MIESSTSKMINQRSSNVQYRNLTEKFARLNQTQRSSLKRSDPFSIVVGIKDINTFTDKATSDVPVIYTQEDRRMMREELQKEIIKREMEIIQKRTRKSALYLPTRSQLGSSLKMMLYTGQRKPVTMRTATMIYGKFRGVDVERLRNILIDLDAQRKQQDIRNVELEGVNVTVLEIIHQYYTTIPSNQFANNENAEMRISCIRISSKR